MPRSVRMTHAAAHLLCLIYASLCFRRFVDIGMQPCLKMNGIHFPGCEFGYVREVYRVDLFHLRYYLCSRAAFLNKCADSVGGKGRCHIGCSHYKDVDADREYVVPPSAKQEAEELTPQQALGRDAERAPRLDAEFLVPDAPACKWQATAVDQGEVVDHLREYEQDEGRDREICYSDFAPAEKSEEFRRLVFEHVVATVFLEHSAERVCRLAADF